MNVIYIHVLSNANDYMCLEQSLNTGLSDFLVTWYRPSSQTPKHTAASQMLVVDKQKRGLNGNRTTKEEHIQNLHLPYTYIENIIITNLMAVLHHIHNY